MGYIYREHLKKRYQIKNFTFNGKKINLVEIWECQFDKQCKIDNELKLFIKKSDILSPLNVRDSFFGGRKECFKLYHKVKEEEQIKYFDFTSLYPYVQKYRTFPIGHPEIIIKNFNDISEYFGFVKLKILAPYKLYLPVLPIKAKNGKLLFALCQACANNQSFECNHCDEERAILGTYCTEEVKEALKKGYKILKIYEVWHFKEKSNDLFVKYINMFLKHKQQSSGFPSNVNTEGNISKMKK